MRVIPVAAAAALSIPLVLVFSLSSFLLASLTPGGGAGISTFLVGEAERPIVVFCTRAGPPSIPTTIVPAVSNVNHSGSRKAVLWKIVDDFYLVPQWGRNVTECIRFLSVLGKINIVDYWWRCSLTCLYSMTQNNTRRYSLPALFLLGSFPGSGPTR